MSESEKEWSMRRMAMLLAGCTLGVLVLMVITGVITGATQEKHEHFMAPEEYALSLLAEPKGLRTLMGLDIAFAILYTAFFAAFTKYLRALGRPFVTLAFGAMLATAILDFIEDHHIISMLESAEHRVFPTASAIQFQAAESAVKFSMSFLALVLYGLAVPRTTKLGLALCLFLVVGTLISGVLGYSAPPEFQAKLEGGRWIGFLIGLGLAIAWLRSAPEPAAATPSP
ncbi:MAG TPA: hypothetical protein VMZ53_07780 [Kofleriaceae bacterium]|nr:hypothetical protein [Kofleriaceae bacterium]